MTSSPTSRKPTTWRARPWYWQTRRTTKGSPCTKYLKFDREKGRPLTYSQNPDLAQTVAPSNESRTQLAVNNEGKTNEATRHLKEPLTQGQTAPKDEAQKQQQEKPKKSKGMKVS